MVIVSKWIKRNLRVKATISNLFSLDFIEWVHDDREEYLYAECQKIKQSMTKFMQNNYVHLMNLLKLSVLFMVDELTSDITDIIVLFWLKPHIVIRIWEAAHKLSLTALQDVCLSVCLDRFEELPLYSLVKLSKPFIINLLHNINVRASIKFLRLVREEWLRNHVRAVIPDVTLWRLPKFIDGTVVYQKYEGIIEDAHVYTWNGCDFAKCVQIRHVQDSVKGMVGMHVVGRGFSIYTVGGELGFGTGKFNNIIWRYCLISKKWYYHATLRAPRRHMVVAFIKNKMIIVGGVGRHRLKLTSVEILDIHTGVWSSGAEIPESFTMAPPHCIINQRLYIIKSALYIYNPKKNHWKTVQLVPYFNNWDVCLTDNSAFFQIGERRGKRILSRVEVIRERTCYFPKCLEYYLEHKVEETDYVFTTSCFISRSFTVDGLRLGILKDIRDESHLYPHIHKELRTDFNEDSVVSPTECFKIIDPDSLYLSV
ncbi:uncharacterized protein LOC143209381 isoform X2 [Lasioglossum baleicum]|uniref:uncharacterized protein LOC143209381 isoform X2 n=1 Tax=Lasioglossum baleicum TaxID=434251 RepID=UPI003FCE02F5